MTLNKPNLKPNNPNFFSGLTTKRSNWSLSNLESTSLDRSHRAKEWKEWIDWAYGETKIGLD